jgi:ABC-type uncharacterized transport system YnjBCD substrate-binding protein
MKKRLWSLLLLGFTLTACISAFAWGANNYDVTLNIATAGVTNMEELQRVDIAKILTNKYPGMKLNVVGTGPGDDGSQKIYEKLKAQREAGKSEWDIDVAIVHQGIMGNLIQDGLLTKYVAKTDIAKYVVGDNAKNSLGASVGGYVIPLFQSQVAIAYNSDTVKTVPDTFGKLEKWIQDHPNSFGYNGVKNGMSGVAFVTSYIYTKTGDYQQLTKGPYNKKLEQKWPAILKSLKALPVTYTSGNDGTLDMLNRGEITMGPVWADMFYSMVAQGRMNPKVKLKLIAPGLPSQPMYIVIPAKAKNLTAAIHFAQLLASPTVQADVIVEKYNWYPGIDTGTVLSKCSPAAKDHLFKDISPDDIKKYSQSFMLAPYKTDLLEAYESVR